MYRLTYKKQRNYCVFLMHENKKQYYGSLNVNHITDNKNFWRVVKPNFSNKIIGTNRVILRNGGKVISNTEILNEINSLDTSKSTQSEDIPFKIIKDNADIFANLINAS